MPLTSVEKLNAEDRKSAPGREAAVTSLAVFVVSCAQVPFPISLVFEEVKLHSSELVDVVQEPVYTEISPRGDIDGMKALLLLSRNGGPAEMVWKDRFDVEMLEDMFSDTNWVVESVAGKKAYAMSRSFEEGGGRRMVVGL